ncbi:MAG: IS110 family transposase [Betaproteobacteria bacterium]|nr:MAG: IS110 family transposase [Betaproteobacteria bacterium]
MEQITTVGIDLAKSVFSLHGVDGAGRVVLRKTVRRDQLVATVAVLSPCLIGMEACSGAHEWGRRFQEHGHTVRLMAPKFVAPYRKSGKNDGNDAEAICEAVTRPSMRFVPVKSAEQQALLALHRVRQGFVVERTALINRLRGLMSEFGVVLPLRSVTVRRQAAAAAEVLPELARRAIGDLIEQLRALDERIGGYDREIEAQARLSEPAQRLMKIRGIGATTALAIVATVGNAREFKNGRQFAAWIGLVPGQYSTGGKSRLGHISKRGDAYLRNLLVQGARSVLNSAASHQDRMSRWILELQPRRGYYRTLVAIANKNARIAWALLAKNEPLRQA